MMLELFPDMVLNLDSIASIQFSNGIVTISFSNDSVQEIVFNMTQADYDTYIGNAVTAGHINSTI